MPAVQDRRNTKASWTAADPILGLNEIGVETGGAADRFKIGDGLLKWSQLQYFVSELGSTPVVPISQAAFDALTPKNASTLYVIVN